LIVSMITAGDILTRKALSILITVKSISFMPIPVKW
jgi:hypothetical protein